MASQATREQGHDATAEIAGLKEENLRLRDLLIGKDAELGALRGQIAALEAGNARLLSLAAAIRSLPPAFVWVLLGKVRRRLRS